MCVYVVYVSGAAYCAKNIYILLQDVGIPLMRDPRWEPDTLFMVFEEDFRFTPHDAEPNVMKASGLQEMFNEQPAANDSGERVPLDATNTVA